MASDSADAALRAVFDVAEFVKCQSYHPSFAATRLLTLLTDGNGAYQSLGTRARYSICSEELSKWSGSVTDKNLADSFMEEFVQQLMDSMNHSGPIYYNDEGLSLVREATLKVWNAMDPVDQKKLVDESHKFVISCLQ